MHPRQVTLAIAVQSRLARTRKGEVHTHGKSRLARTRKGEVEYYVKKARLFHICLHSVYMTDDFYVSVMDRLLKFIAGYKGVQFKCASEVTA